MINGHSTLGVSSRLLAQGIHGDDGSFHPSVMYGRRQQFINHNYNRHMRDKVLLAEHEERQRKREEAQVVSDVRQVR